MLNIIGTNSKRFKLKSSALKSTAYNSTFAKWWVEKVLVRSVFNLTFVVSRQVEVPNPPIRKSEKRYASFYGNTAKSKVTSI
jgi:hypothetical protein